MDAHVGIQLAGVINAFSIFSLSFSIGWFVIYATVGSWLKVRLIHFKQDPAIDVPKRYGPVIVSHILCSLLFVNPWLLFYILLCLNAQVKSGYLLLTIAVLYFLTLPIGTDCLVTRFLPKWSRLKWFEYRPSLKRLTLANLVVSTLAFAVAFPTSVICARMLG